MGTMARETWREIQRLESEMSDLLKSTSTSMNPKTAYKGRKGQTVAPPKLRTDYYPRTDFRETPHHYEITMETAGIDNKDLDVELENDLLTVRGVKPGNQHQEGERYLAKERKTGSFARSFTLIESPHLDISQVKAVYTNGLLRIIVPKQSTEERKTHFQVPVTEP